MYRTVLVLILLTVAACATSRYDPMLPEPAASGSSSQSSETIQEQAIYEQGSSDDGVLADNKVGGEFSGIEELPAPRADETPPEMIPNPATPEPQIACQRVVPTGSILPVKVCQHRSEIAQREETDQRAFDTIKRNTAIGASRL